MTLSNDNRNGNGGPLAPPAQIDSLLDMAFTGLVAHKHTDPDRLAQRLGSVLGRLQRINRLDHRAVKSLKDDIETRLDEVKPKFECADGQSIFRNGGVDKSEFESRCAERVRGELMTRIIEALEAKARLLELNSHCRGFVRSNVLEILGDVGEAIQQGVNWINSYQGRGPSALRLLEFFDRRRFGRTYAPPRKS